MRRFPNGRLGIIPALDQIERRSPPRARSRRCASRRGAVDDERSSCRPGKSRASGAASTARASAARSRRSPRSGRTCARKVGGVPRPRPGAWPRRRRTCRCSSATTTALYEELLGIAEGAIVSPEEIVVANHYTDLRDLDPDPETWQSAPTRDDPDAARHARGADALGGDGCSVLWAEIADRPHPRADLGHARDRDPVRDGAGVPESDDGPAARLLTVTGCLGMAGMNAARVGDRDQQPVLDRRDARRRVAGDGAARAARATPRAAARDVIVGEPDRLGPSLLRRRSHARRSRSRRRARGASVWCSRGGAAARTATRTTASTPTSPRVSKVPPTRARRYERMHVARARPRARAGRAISTTRGRGSAREDGWPRSICTNMATPEAPHGAATCGAIAMNLDTGELWAQQGFIHNVAPGEVAAVSRLSVLLHLDRAERRQAARAHGRRGRVVHHRRRRRAGSTSARSATRSTPATATSASSRRSSARPTSCACRRRTRCSRRRSSSPSACSRWRARGSRRCSSRSAAPRPTRTRSRSRAWSPAGTS